MKSWPTLLLSLLVLGLLCYIYFDLREAPTTAQAEENAKKVFQFEQDQVDRVELTNATGAMVFSRQAGVWSIEKPIQFPGEPYSINRLLSSLLFLHRIATIPEREISLDQAMDRFALKEPRMQVTIKTTGQSFSFALGKPTLAAGGIYALVTTGHKREVIVVPEEIGHTLEKGLEEWRGHTVVDVPQNEVDGIVLRRDQSETEVRKKDGKWQIVKPLVTAADPDSVDKFLQELGSIRAVKFISETDGNSPTYGLNAPAMILEIYHKGKVNRLKIGSNPKDDLSIWNASYDPRPAVFTLPRPSIDLLESLLDFVRDKKITTAEIPSDVLKLKIVLKDFTLAIHRDSTSSTVWKSEDGSLMDLNTVQQFLSQFLMSQVMVYPSGSQAQAFSAAKQLASIEITYTNVKQGLQALKSPEVKTPPAATENIILAPGLKNDPKEPIFASTPRQNGPVFVSPNLLRLLPDQPWSWLARSVIASTEPMTSLTWKTSDGETTLALQGADGWKITQGKGNIDKNLLALQQKVLNNLRAIRWIGPPGKNDFQKPLATVKIVRGTKTDLLEFGLSLTDKTIVTRLNGNPWAFLVSFQDFRLLSAPPVNGEIPPTQPAPVATPAVPDPSKTH